MSLAGIGLEIARKNGTLKNNHIMNNSRPGWKKPKRIGIYSDTSLWIANTSRAWDHRPWCFIKADRTKIPMGGAFVYTAESWEVRGRERKIRVVVVVLKISILGRPGRRYRRGGQANANPGQVLMAPTTAPSAAKPKLGLGFPFPLCYSACLRFSSFTFPKSFFTAARS